MPSCIPMSITSTKVLSLPEAQAASLELCLPGAIGTLSLHSRAQDQVQPHYLLSLLFLSKHPNPYSVPHMLPPVPCLLCAHCVPGMILEARNEQKRLVPRL